MKRKIMKLGQGYVFTLPVDWIREYGLNSKDEIDIDRRGHSLVVAHDKEKAIENIKLKLSGNRNQIINRLIAGYRRGTDEIEVMFDNLEVEDRKGNKIKTSKLIQVVTDSLMGVSIIKQRPNYCLIKDITKADNKEFDNILRRMFILLNAISEESLKAVKTKNKKLLSEVPITYKNLRKFVHYALRLLNKYEYHNHTKTANMYAIVNSINDMADSFRHIAKHYSKPNIRIKDEFIVLYQDLTNLIRLMYELFYDFKDS